MVIVQKVLKWCALAIVTIFILILLFTWLVASGIDETTIYTEKDFFSYHTLTDKDIQHAPRISDNYHFQSRPGDGYAPSNSIIFKGVRDIEPLHDYLNKLGYTQQKTSSIEAEMWLKSEQGGGDLFFIYYNRESGEAELTKEMSY